MNKISVKIFRMGNQRGQAAIFVALMFNVLFVFFAMAINVALVVHDKINLQNSVDLAAYYAATKQAEVLNAIAHTNYQIRQSYKLLAWRYRVLGNMGLSGSNVHPAKVPATATVDVLYPPGEGPSVCVYYSDIWDDVPKTENLCKDLNQTIPELPDVKEIFSLIFGNVQIAESSIDYRVAYGEYCDKLAAHNWWYGMSILHAFRLDQRNRKALIYALGANLSRGDDFLDLDGNSVLEGARQTFIKNLTYTNRSSFEGGSGEFTLVNSLAGVEASKWLVEIKIAPALLYSDRSTVGCNSINKPLQSPVERPSAKEILRRDVNSGGLGAVGLEQWMQDSILQASDYQFSIGVEKNPWYMAYVGVRASTTPRQIFFPFAGGVAMAARAFAKPFGGRIGPWYMSSWDQSAQASGGGKMVDELMAPRVGTGGLPLNANDKRRFPNYSRFPGDTLGLKSRLALASINGLAANLRANFDFYRNIKADFSIGGANDILPWNFKTQEVPDVRNVELAAITPDLFDITYYSIEPNFTKNYLERIQANRNALGIPGDLPLRPDLGFRTGVTPTYSIQDQLKMALEKSYWRPESFYFVRSKAHLLTDWLPGPGAFNYKVGDALASFGRCALPDDNLKFRNPGSCVAGGGRTGYSVKLISRDALLSGQHAIGGEGAAPGPIQNPPDASAGW